MRHELGNNGDYDCKIIEQVVISNRQLLDVGYIVDTIETMFLNLYNYQDISNIVSHEGEHLSKTSVQLFSYKKSAILLINVAFLNCSFDLLFHLLTRIFKE